MASNLKCRACDTPMVAVVAIDHLGIRVRWCPRCGSLYEFQEQGNRHVWRKPLGAKGGER